MQQNAKMEWHLQVQKSSLHAVAHFNNYYSPEGGPKLQREENINFEGTQLQ